MDITYEIREQVQQHSRILSQLLPYEQYGSAYSLFSAGYKAGLITRNEYEIAEEYYGRLWNYAGD